MKENEHRFAITDRDIFKMKMLNWASRFSIFCFLDNNNYKSADPYFEFLLAAGSERSIDLTPGNPFETLQSFFDEQPGWLFGHLGFDVNNSDSHLIRSAGFSDGFFFSPHILVRCTSDEVIINAGAGEANSIFNSINEQPSELSRQPGQTHISSRMSREEYLEMISKIRQHIKRGDCYELNFCQQFFSENAFIDPLSVFAQLQQVSPNPFSAFYKVNDDYCMCASPERFLKKTGQELMSQPIKGTSRRENDPLKDKKSLDHLKESPKERSENVMIVDLVRNDLSKVCVEGSVYVDELFGIYSFPQVHQMISTIKGSLPYETHWTKALEATFPMGSMTGAPKKKVIELISQYEMSRRGLFSGSIGYITPWGDFDFNVVIRSIFYNRHSCFLSFSTGGGITYNSDPEKEYEECLLKAAAIMQVLNA